MSERPSIQRLVLGATETVEVPDGHVVCPRCKGAGGMSKYDEGWSSLVHHPEMAAIRGCYRCSGRGYVPEETRCPPELADLIEDFHGVNALVGDPRQATRSNRPPPKPTDLWSRLLRGLCRLGLHAPVADFGEGLYYCEHCGKELTKQWR